MPIAKTATKRRAEAGYSLLMVVFMVATMLVLASATVPNILTEGRRERETETIWRGEQYERAIGLYYRKTGKYPTKIDDLTNETNGVRFLRKAYTDPLNKEDGSWRMIYVGPNGQLIGSLTRFSLLQVGPTTPAAGLGSVLSGGAQPGTATTGFAASGPGGAAPGATPQAGAASGLSSGAASPNPLESQPQPLEGDVIGGNIVGVASKIKMPSLRVYNGEDNYQKWEFIWSPTQNGLAPGAAQPVQPVPGAPGATPQTPGAGFQTPQGMPQIPGGISDQPPATSP